MELRLPQEIEQESEDVLGDGVGAVDGNVGHGDAARARGLDVDDVVTGGEDADELQLRELGEGLRRQRRLVGQENVRVEGPFDNLIHGRAIVADEFTELGDIVPGIVTGVQRGAVEYNDFHSVISIRRRRG